VSGKYRTIVADPPWEIPGKTMRAGGRRHRDTEVDYEFMSTSEIEVLPVESLAAEAGRQRVTSGTGTRGGNVRNLTEARGLQEEQKEKARWTLIVREHIARTLLETCYFHADDLDALGVPPSHCNVKGSQIGSFRSRGLMEKTGQERKVSHAAANGRKAPIYRVSAKGRKELSKMLVGVGGGFAATGSPTVATATGHTLHSGENAGAGAGDPESSARAEADRLGVASEEPILPADANGDLSGGEASADPGEKADQADPGNEALTSFHPPGSATRLFEPAPAAPSAYDPFSEAA